MSVLVTGGAGYIGSHTVRLLVERGEDVVVLDSLEFGHRAAIPDVPLGVGDIGDRALVRRIVDEHAVESVIHFAGYKAAGESMEQPQRYFDNNVARSAALLEVLDDAGVTRFVFSSSCSVYGSPRELPVGEDHATAPESPYGASKLMVEQRASGVDFRVDLVARRPGDPVAVYADNRRAGRVLGWKPTYPLEQIVETAWRWSSTHPQGYATDAGEAVWLASS
jgi:UDP-glucose 4-epimerase